MTTDLLTANPEWTVDRLATFFNQHVITGAPVVDEDGDLVGVVSITDIARRKSLVGDDTAEFRIFRPYHASADDAYDEEDLMSLRTEAVPDATVEDIMTQEVYSVDVDDTVQRIADTMLKRRIHRVLVTENGRLKGLITAFDLVRIVRDM